MIHALWLLVLPAAYLALTANATHLLILAVVAAGVLVISFVGVSWLDEFEKTLDEEQS